MEQMQAAFENLSLDLSRIRHIPPHKSTPRSNKPFDPRGLLSNIDNAPSLHEEK